MGWTVLYIAFGVVALWLLGEVLLQYKARLRWRLLAFCGFLLVVVGVVMPSVAVIALGTVAFATGQTFVTLSFRRGFSTGWALGGKPGTSRRRRGVVRPLDPVPDDAEPLDATPAEGVPRIDEDGAGQGPAPEGDGDREPDRPQDDTPYQDPYLSAYATGGDPWADQQTPSYAAPQDTGETYTGYPADPYLDQQPQHEHAAQDTYATGYPGDWSGQESGQWQTAGQYGAYYQETPPGGVWVPQQRDDDAGGYGYPPQQPADGPDGYPQTPGYEPSDPGHYYGNEHRY
ncbi:hypothetical protein [Streptomyces sp. RFCAC02]|uniref:hypothetical protein n=1 Tax=Streptomyces sp. RFCAC02 TaxID=2499143 RepID=UPI0019D040F5|nr:hypothetical protein [Streptomyces sp. RFCAC02]